ncbi:parallel beta-helix domain-containing protein [Sphingoaurantiacus capsulatus]|uniref:Parallel beta-helix domain-containing protein n=1 Tax=Sphingoaurantiacus capsulatus TaxID=1771310 RepID=A0ABV7X4K9_9SPHN
MTKTLLIAALLAASATPALAKTITVNVTGDAREAIQTALIEAKPGDVIELPAGTFALDEGLSLDVDNVTVKGAGTDKTILSFKGQTGAGEGLLVTSDRVLLTGFAVEDSKGDGIKSKGSDRITFHDLRVEWTGGPKATNGAYGVYPVSSTNVLVDKVTVRGASDAGIYVGQSKNIVVKNSLAEFNVAGIEIENSMNADVHDNVTTRNTGAILVFDLPNLPQMGGHSTRIFRNKVVANDTPNFAPKGNIVASVPMGTGVMVMANRNVHVFDNEFDGNATAHVMVIAYSQEIKDKTYNPLPREVFIGANQFGKGGWDPGFPGGKQLAAAAGGALPPVVWDGAEGWTIDGQAKGEKVRLAFAGGKVMSFGMPTAPGDPSKAKPAVIDVPTTAASPIVAVTLPADQPGVK